MTRGQRGPWSECLEFNRDRLSGPSVFLPTIQIRPFDALRSQKSFGPEHEAKCAQSSALIHLNYGESLDQQLVNRDCFFLFQELFEFSAFSIAQFLNLIDDNIFHEFSSGRSEDSESKQANLLYIQTILENLERCLRQNLQVINSRGMNWWHRAENARQTRKYQQAADSLLRDYDALFARTTTLRDRCRSQINDLVTQTMLAESKKAIIQANEVTKLTRMAFILIPLSFTCGLFGMVVSPIVSNAPPWWAWVAITFPILVLSIVFLKWSPRDLSDVIGRRSKPKN